MVTERSPVPADDRKPEKAAEQDPAKRFKKVKKNRKGFTGVTVCLSKGGWYRSKGDAIDRG